MEMATQTLTNKTTSTLLAEKENQKRYKKPKKSKVSKSDLALCLFSSDFAQV